MFWNKRKPKDENDNTVSTQANATMSNEEMYGKAWLLMAGQTYMAQGLQIMKDLDAKGYVEGTIVLAMFSDSQERRKALVKKAADAGNAEGMWEYAGFLPHSFCPDQTNNNDAVWERYCLNAAEGGSVDAMNEMGNVFHRRKMYVRSMYWYAMANAHGQSNGSYTMRCLAEEWARAGKPIESIANTSEVESARHYCALCYLKIHAKEELNINMDRVMKYVLDGVPIAAYLAGDIFESNNDYKMAYTVYNAISFEKDPHGLRCYADMLFYGKGVERDLKGAIRFYQMAAEAGDREAMFIMGELTKEINQHVACYWYGLSHTRGHQLALSRLIQLADD